MKIASARFCGSQSSDNASLDCRQSFQVGLPDGSAPQPAATEPTTATKSAGANSKLDKTWGQGQADDLLLVERALETLSVLFLRYARLREYSQIKMVGPEDSNPNERL
ncbi:hypothetical protein HFN60_02115 [Rhizobium leguminosarum]|uniref:hypothetical protein n=1 Tax=Rhizobium leguminosarum TaxID=384 RepID=UPI001C949534|nr:hypothetical protein [Rhizobium leguminosarum]MBY5814456.1 hypothetical protein [Rhizobium leguminosarum]